jgi:hypothetical protein
MTAPAFDHDRDTRIRALQQLATLLREDLALALPEYLRAVADIPWPELRAGIDRAARVCTYFPRPAELREQCDLARAEWKPAEAVIASADPIRVCTRCEDSGWIFVAERTDRAQPTVRRCECYRTNPRLVAPKSFSGDPERRRA